MPSLPCLGAEKEIWKGWREVLFFAGSALTSVFQKERISVTRGMFRSMSPPFLASYTSVIMAASSCKAFLILRLSWESCIIVVLVVKTMAWDSDTLSSQASSSMVSWYDWIRCSCLGLSSPICQRRSGTQWSLESLSVLSFWFQIPREDRVECFGPALGLQLIWDLRWFQFKEVTTCWVPTTGQAYAGCSRTTETIRHVSSLLQLTARIRIHMSLTQVEFFTYCNVNVYVVPL